MEIWRDPDSRLGLFTTLRTGYVAAPVSSVYLGPHATARSEQLPGGVNVELLQGRPHALAAPPTVINACLHVPPELRGQLEDLAEQLFDPSDTTARKVDAVQRYFRSQYRYKLGIAVPYDADPLEWFLSEKPPAHCEFFAAAATLVLRAGGVPARYVTGFVARERNSAGGYWIARNRDAHAWAEAYDPVSRRWMTVEATPADGVPGDEKTPLLAGLLDAAEQALLSLRTAQFRHGIKGVAIWLARALVLLLSLLVTTWVGWLILAVLAAWLGPRTIRRLARLLRRPRRRPTDPQIQALGRLLDRMDRRVARLGLARRDGETLHRFAARVEPRDPAAAAWYLAYARRRYSARLRPTDLDALRNDLPTKADRPIR
jgi:transglutaminase-like putative cysteine protease